MILIALPISERYTNRYTKRGWVASDTDTASRLRECPKYYV
jgi:hypothetical protein